MDEQIGRIKKVLGMESFAREKNTYKGHQGLPIRKIQKVRRRGHGRIHGENLKGGPDFTEG